ncbi:hypothetical protein B0J13DRAFT_501121 [Dactylonectria estremocensis]|uniref:NAD(P)-binding domain-containing protein n=1 Tax=Dactylonectria estremocensis TaxID=1079267 RepID=A0A9P9EUB0_9HYPO|nr:hypothetical protein B0J13DRAFT_501121 [Dactylonectria estremocensis]
MSTIHHVALLGKGFLGTAVLKELLAKGFEVTVFTRIGSAAKDLPEGVHVAQVDYSSLSDLTKALKGKDAVVSTLNGNAIPGQTLVIDAAIQAGVKRFVPADFGSLTTDPKARDLPCHYTMVQIQQYLAEKARDGQIEWTIFSTGPFLDLIFTFPFVFNYANQTAELFDNGNHRFSGTTTSSIGKAIAASFKNPEATKNRNVFIHDIVTSQGELIEIAKNLSPAGVEWTVTNVDGKAELQKLLDDVANNGPNHGNIIGMLKAAILSGGYASEYKVVDNELLGLGIWSKEDLEALVASKVQ